MSETNYTFHNLQEKVIIKFLKTNSKAKLPTKAHKGDNSFDLYCCEETTIPGSKVVNGEFIVGQAVIPIGLTVAYISPGFGFVTKNKSGLSFKHNLVRMAGEIDNGYRSDLGVKLLNFSNKDYKFSVNDKVVQIKIEKIYDTELMFTESIEEAQDERGEGGFGSSGR
jgi:dUTP pyrophosphatase